MLVVFFIALVFHFGALYFSTDYGFYNDVSFQTVVYSTIDLFLSFIVCYLVFLRFPKIKAGVEAYYYRNYYYCFVKYKYLIVLLLIWALFLATKSFQLISSGAFRHQLINEFDTGGFDYMLISGFFKIFVAFVFYFKSSFWLKLVAILGLLATVVITASRSELRYVIHFFLILMIFNKGYEGHKRFVKFIVISFSMVFFAILATTFLQNRPISDGLYAFIDIVRTVFQYRSYGYFLADISIVDSGSLDKALFPFGGYISEYFIRLVGGPEVPIDSNYVGYLHVLGISPETGRPYLANVVYPWWSWFVGTYGFLGLLIKAVFSFILISICLSFRLLFTLVLLLSFVLLGTAVSHPFMTLTHVFAFFISISIDLLVKFYGQDTKLLRVRA